MGPNYNIHSHDDDSYYYCPNNDCPCHDNGAIDNSGSYASKDNRVSDDGRTIYDNIDALINDLINSDNDPDD